MGMSMCMGVEKYRYQCINCLRLPKSPEEEETQHWIKINTELNNCVQYRGKKISRGHYIVVTKEK